MSQKSFVDHYQIGPNGNENGVGNWRIFSGIVQNHPGVGMRSGNNAKKQLTGQKLETILESNVRMHHLKMKFFSLQVATDIVNLTALTNYPSIIRAIPNYRQGDLLSVGVDGHYGRTTTLSSLRYFGPLVNRCQ